MEEAGSPETSVTNCQLMEYLIPGVSSSCQFRLFWRFRYIIFKLCTNKPINQVQRVSLSFLCARQLLGDTPADAGILYHKPALLGEAVKIHFTVPFPYQSLWNGHCTQVLIQKIVSGSSFQNVAASQWISSITRISGYRVICWEKIYWVYFNVL
jgi:hypothetical protein